jgi:hypothetical protein
VPRHCADLDFNDARSDCEVGAFDWRTPAPVEQEGTKSKDIKRSIPLKGDTTS